MLTTGDDPGGLHPKLKLNLKLNLKLKQMERRSLRMSRHCTKA